CQPVAPIFRASQLDRGDARKVLSQRVGVLLCSCAQRVKIDLLVEIQVSVGPLAMPWIARVVKPRAIRVPGDAASSRAAVDTRNDVIERAPRRDLIDVDVARLAAAL